VADTFNNQVQEFTSAGTFLQRFGTLGYGGSGSMADPEGITFDGSGSLWVASLNSGTLPYYIQKFNSSGTYQSEIGLADSYSNGGDQGATNIAFNSSGSIWVMDAADYSINEYTSAGSWIQQIAGTGSACTACACTGATGGSNCTTGHSAAAGTGNGQFSISSSQSMGIAFDSNGNIWATDMGNQRVQEFTSAGTYLMQF
jgi:tripartite motif-containing protein 71